MAQAKRELADMINSLGKKKKNKMNKTYKTTPGYKKTSTPGWMTQRNEIGYIVENGLRGNDADQYKNNRNDFRNNVNNMVRDNEGKAMQQGQKTIYYPLLRKKNK